MRKDKEKALALKMRKQGESYSQIKAKLKVSKGTLSRWLQNHPLSGDQMRKLRDLNPKRIEGYRETMRKKKEEYEGKMFLRALKDIKPVKKRDIFIAGIFLYLGEGGKTTPYSATVSNTDPTILKWFIKWLALYGVGKDQIRIKLHLYSNMNFTDEKNYWKYCLKLKDSNFVKPYIKQSSSDSITYLNSSKHGTCNVTVHGKEIAQYMHACLKAISKLV